MAAQEFAPAEPIIHLHRNVVDRLRREVGLALESAPPQGMEISGLLLGEVDRQADIVEIRDFAPLLYEDRPDHRFVLSDSERRALQKMLATRDSIQDGTLQVVGCYRSQICEDLTLSKEDLSSARACFGGSLGVFLLLRPAPNGDLSAGFFFWGTGLIDSAYTFQEFPFDTRWLAGALVRPSNPVAQEIAEWIDKPAPDHNVPSTALPVSQASVWREHRFQLRWRPLVVVLAVVLSVWWYRAYRNRTPAMGAGTAGLALQVERRENDLCVRWDPDAPAVRFASKGVLLIREGDSPPRELPLDVEQLRSGGTVYIPTSARVQFRLEVTGTDNTKSTESVLTVVAARQNLTQGLATGNRQPDAASATDRKQMAHPTGPASKRDLPAGVAQAHRPAETRSVPSRPLALHSDAAIQQPAPATPAAVARSNAITQASTASLVNVEELASSPAAFAAEQPIGSSPVEVWVKVRIDESGRVVRADPVALTGPASIALLAATKRAALRWKFAPAMRGNQPIATETVLKFSYAPTR